MDLQQIAQHFEYCCSATPLDPVAYQHTTDEILKFKNSPNPYEVCFLVLERRTSETAAYHALDCIYKALITESNLGTISNDKVNQICSSVLSYGVSNVKNLKPFLQNTICRIVALCHICTIPQQQHHKIIQILLSEPTLLTLSPTFSPNKNNPASSSNNHITHRLMQYHGLNEQDALYTYHYITSLQQYTLDIAKNIATLFTSNNTELILFSTTYYMKQVISEANFMTNTLYDKLLFKRILMHLVIQHLLLPFFALLLLHNVDKLFTWLTVITKTDTSPTSTNGDFFLTPQTLATPAVYDAFALLHSLLTALRDCLDWKWVEKDLLSLLKNFELSNCKTKTNLPESGEDNEDGDDDQQHQQIQLIQTKRICDDESLSSIDAYNRVILGPEWRYVFIGLNHHFTTNLALLNHSQLSQTSLSLLQRPTISSSSQNDDAQYYRIFDLIAATDASLQSAKTIPPIAQILSSLYALLLAKTTQFYSTNTSLRYQAEFNEIDGNSNLPIMVEDLTTELRIVTETLAGVNALRGTDSRVSKQAYLCFNDLSYLFCLLFQITGPCFSSPVTQLDESATITPTTALLHNIHYRNHIYWLTQSLALSIFDFSILTQLHYHAQQAQALHTMVASSNTSVHKIEEPIDLITAVGNFSSRLLFVSVQLVNPLILFSMPLLLPLSKVVTIQNAPNIPQIPLFSTFLDFDWLKAAVLILIHTMLPQSVAINDVHLQHHQNEQQQLSRLSTTLQFNQTHQLQSPFIPYTVPGHTLPALLSTTTVSWVASLPHIFSTLLLSQIYPNIPLSSSAYVSQLYSLMERHQTPVQLQLACHNPQILPLDDIFASQPIPFSNTTQYLFLPFTSSSQLQFAPRVTNISFAFTASRSTTPITGLPLPQAPNSPSIIRYASLHLPLAFHQQLACTIASHVSWTVDIIDQTRDVTRLLSLQQQQQQTSVIQYFHKLSPSQSAQVLGIFTAHHLSIQSPNTALIIPSSITSSSSLLSHFIAFLLTHQHSPALQVALPPATLSGNHVIQTQFAAPTLPVPNATVLPSDLGELALLLSPTLSLYTTTTLIPALTASPMFLRQFIYTYLHSLVLSSCSSAFKSMAHVNSTQPGRPYAAVGNNIFDDDYHHCDDSCHDDEDQAIRDRIDDSYTNDIIISLATILRGDIATSSILLTNTITIFMQQLLALHATHAPGATGTNVAQLHSNGSVQLDDDNTDETKESEIENQVNDILECLTSLFQLALHLLHNKQDGESTSIPSHNLHFFSFAHTVNMSLLPQISVLNSGPQDESTTVTHAHGQWVALFFKLPQLIISFSDNYIKELLPASFRQATLEKLISYSTFSSSKCQCLSTRLTCILLSFISAYTTCYIPLLLSQEHSIDPQQQSILANRNREALGQLPFYHDSLCSVFGSYHHIPALSSTYIQTLTTSISNISLLLTVLWSEEQEIVTTTCSLMSLITNVLIKQPTLLLPYISSIVNIYCLFCLSTKLFQPILHRHWTAQLAQLSEGQKLTPITETAANGILINFHSLPEEVINVIRFKHSEFSAFVSRSGIDFSLPKYHQEPKELSLYTLAHYDESTLLSLGQVVNTFLSSTYRLAIDPQPTKVATVIRPQYIINYYQQIVNLVLSRHTLLLQNAPYILLLQSSGNLELLGLVAHTAHYQFGLPLVPGTESVLSPLIQQHMQFSATQQEYITTFAARAIDDDPSTQLLPKYLNTALKQQDKASQTLYPLIHGNIVSLLTLLTSDLSQESPHHFNICFYLLHSYITLLTMLLKPYTLRQITPINQPPLDANGANGNNAAHKNYFNLNLVIPTDLLQLIQFVLSLFSSIYAHYCMKMSFLLFSLLSIEMIDFIHFITQPILLINLHLSQLYFKLAESDDTTPISQNSIFFKAIIYDDSLDTVAPSNGDNNFLNMDKSTHFNQSIITACCEISHEIMSRLATKPSDDLPHAPISTLLTIPEDIMTSQTQQINQLLHTNSITDRSQAQAVSLLTSSSLQLARQRGIIIFKPQQQPTTTMALNAICLQIVLLSSLANISRVLNTPILHPHTHTFYTISTTQPNTMNTAVQTLVQASKSSFKPLFLSYLPSIQSHHQTGIHQSFNNELHVLQRFHDLPFTKQVKSQQPPSQHHHAVLASFSPFYSFHALLLTPMFDLINSYLVPEFFAHPTATIGQNSPKQQSVLHDDILRYCYIFLTSFVILHKNLVQYLLVYAAGARIKTDTRQFIEMMQQTYNTLMNLKQQGVLPATIAQTLQLPSQATDVGLFISLPNSSYTINVMDQAQVTLDPSNLFLILYNTSPQIINNIWVPILIPTTIFINKYCWPMLLSTLFSKQLTALYPSIASSHASAVINTYIIPKPYINNSGILNDIIEGLYHLVLSLTAYDDLIFNLAQTHSTLLPRTLSMEGVSVTQSKPTEIQAAAAQGMTNVTAVLQDLLLSLFINDSPAQNVTFQILQQFTATIEQMFSQMNVKNLPQSPQRRPTGAGSSGSQHPPNTVTITGTAVHVPYPYSVLSTSRAKHNAFKDILKNILTQLKLGNQ